MVTDDPATLSHGVTGSVSGVGGPFAVSAVTFS